MNRVDVRRLLRPLSLTAITPLRHPRDQLLGDVDVDRERPQVPIVDADRSPHRRRAPRPAPRGRALRRAHRGRAPLRAPAAARARPAAGADDQQHRVGAGRARLEQLILRDDEVLPQQRTSTAARTRTRCSSDPSKNVGSVSTEIAAAPAARSRARSPPDRSRPADTPRRRRPPLALGDDVDAIGPRSAPPGRRQACGSLAPRAAPAARAAPAPRAPRRSAASPRRSSRAGRRRRRWS